MSMIVCDGCGRMIDSDDDPECFVLLPKPIPGREIAGGFDCALCELCRNKETDGDTA